jgi:hypothetical protein
MSPRVSAVIPVYNGEPYIGQAVESLLGQTFRDLEVVVVDDGSTDRTVNVVELIAARDDRVELHRCAHRGAIEAFNFGGRCARGDYLAWLGADDIALPERLMRQVAVLDRHPDVVVVGGAIMATDAHLRPIMLARYPLDDAGIRALLPAANPIAAPAALMRTSAYLELGGVRGAFAGGAEDYDLWLRMADRHRLANVANVMVLYRTHAGQVSQTRAIQMALSMVAAQIAARRRQTGKADELDGRTGVNYELLRELEPDHQLLNDAILMSAAVLASFMATVGNPAAALQLLSWAEATGRETTFSRNARARAAITRGIVAWRMRDPLDLATAGLAAIAANPVYVGRIVGRAFVSSAGLLAERRRNGRVPR